MQLLNTFKYTIFNLQDDAAFERAALSVFYAQATENAIYRDYVNGLKISPSAVKRVADIPFLPISFFKTHEVKTGQFVPEAIFTSSATTGSATSKHLVKEINLYKTSFRKGFEMFYGPAKNFCVLALLPSYLERSGSSLVFMAEDFIAHSNYPQSGFYLNNTSELLAALQQLAHTKTPTLLLGVSFALLDLAELMPKNFLHPNLIVMETGGMKGRRKEMIRGEMHQIFTAAFGVKTIHSEYGMTELLSQAYSAGNGFFKTPPWMRVFVRDTTDPLTLIGHNKTGGLNVLDLANLYSCAFIATEDLGRTHQDGTFEVLGRFDQAEIRGCNLLAQ